MLVSARNLAGRYYRLVKKKKKKKKKKKTHYISHHIPHSPHTPHTPSILTTISRVDSTQHPPTPARVSEALRSREQVAARRKEGREKGEGTGGGGGHGCNHRCISPHPSSFPPSVQQNGGALLATLPPRVWLNATSCIQWGE